MKKHQTYKKNAAGKGLFDERFSAEKLSELGNPLAELSRLVDFEMFRPTLEAALFTEERKGPAGRRPTDCVLMFKILVLQRYYGLGDRQTQYQIIDRSSFREFLGICDVGDVPDEKTVWAFRERLVKAGAFDALFDSFSAFLGDKGLSLSEGRIVDASFVVAPRQRNTHAENKQIKEGCGGELWADKPHKKRHKDTDARWAQKGKEAYYGYKQHAKVGEKTKLILSYGTTDASVHDSKGHEALLDDTDRGQTLLLDAGYAGTEPIAERHGMTPIICDKGVRNHPLTEEQKASNRAKSKIRCRVEHVFGFMEQSMRGLLVRSVGIARAKANTALTCLVYNICRYGQILRCQPSLIGQSAR